MQARGRHGSQFGGAHGFPTCAISSPLLCTSFSMCPGGLADGPSIGFQPFFGDTTLKERMEERVVCKDALGLSGLPVSLELPFPGSQLGACL